MEAANNILRESRRTVQVRSIVVQAEQVQVNVGLSRPEHPPHALPSAHLALRSLSGKRSLQQLMKQVLEIAYQHDILYRISDILYLFRTDAAEVYPLLLPHD